MILIHHAPYAYQSTHTEQWVHISTTDFMRKPTNPLPKPIEHTTYNIHKQRIPTSFDAFSWHLLLSHSVALFLSFSRVRTPLPERWCYSQAIRSTLTQTQTAMHKSTTMRPSYIADSNRVTTARVFVCLCAYVWCRSYLTTKKNSFVFGIQHTSVSNFAIPFSQQQKFQLHASIRTALIRQICNRRRAKNARSLNLAHVAISFAQPLCR